MHWGPRPPFSRQELGKQVRALILTLDRGDNNPTRTITGRRPTGGTAGIHSRFLGREVGGKICWIRFTSILESWAILWFLVPFLSKCWLCLTAVIGYHTETQLQIVPSGATATWSGSTTAKQSLADGTSMAFLGNANMTDSSHWS